MLTGKVLVNNKNGIHLRLAGELVKVAGQFKSTIMIGRNSDLVNAKSILGVAGLGAEYGVELVLNIEGEDEQKAMDTMVHLFESNFNEE
jgi:phosphocarrier protein HPr